MSDMRVDSLLNQIRAIRQQTTMPGAPQQAGINPVDLDVRQTGQIGEVSPRDRVDFGAMLKQSIDSVNDAQQRSSQSAAAFERGDKNVTLTEVMVNMQKADVSMKAAVEVRNKFVDAYNEVMRMSI
ncbi:flagellar hook-basal body complex protein FliE [Spongiibacter sp. KMU-158]|uniref:Flagellar hook-basal body complex protein FliE n=1 Tax=Spongiibacter pelagi TaxID=2760804 RepID=A0A927C2H2_9GAMM|nr:flagellar hook-basal body complex protein FliE [Spongiibacter pelagi]MBD2858431.1 flagellar hook-basal body complex protein FliE [Spongiibacter pelagi]